MSIHCLKQCYLPHSGCSVMGHIANMCQVTSAANVPKLSVFPWCPVSRLRISCLPRPVCTYRVFSLLYTLYNIGYIAGCLVYTAYSTGCLEYEVYSTGCLVYTVYSTGCLVYRVYSTGCVVYRVYSTGCLCTVQGVCVRWWW